MNVEVKLIKIQKISTLIRYFLWGVSGLIALSVLSILTAIIDGNLDLYPLPIKLGGITFFDDSISEKVKVLGSISFILRSMLLIKILYHIIKLFGLYAKGMIFTKENVQQIKLVGISMLLLPTLWILGLIVAFPEINALNQWTTVIRNIPIEMMIIGTVIVLASWIMDLGCGFREENELTV